MLKKCSLLIFIFNLHHIIPIVSKHVENIPVVLRSLLLVDCWKNALSYAAIDGQLKTMSLTLTNQLIFIPINPIVLLLCLCSKPAIMLKIMPAYSTQ